MKRILSILLCLVFCLGLSACNRADTDPAEETTATTVDNDPYTFGSVVKAKDAIKKDPALYENKQITVDGTVIWKEGSLTLSNYRCVGAFEGMQRYYAYRAPAITIVMSDKKMNTLLEDGDYVKITGTVKISDTEIYLDACEYEMIDSIYD